MIGKDILNTAELLSAEHGLSEDVVFGAFENALAIAAKKDFEKEKFDLSCVIDRKTGSYDLFRKWTVVDDNEKNFDNHKHLYDDQAEEKYGREVEIGEVFTEFLVKDKVLSRISAQVFKNAIKEQVRMAIKFNAQEKYTDRIGEVFKVTVSKFSKGDVFVSISDTVEGVIKKESLQKNDRFKIGQTIDAVLFSIVDNYKGQQLMFDRFHDSFVKGVLATEIPDIRDENVEIMSFSRLKGRKTMVAVKSLVPNVDAVSTCIGARGARVKAVREKIGGEAVEFVRWNADDATFISEVLGGKAAMLVIDDVDKRVDVGLEMEAIVSIKNIETEQKLLSDLLGYSVSFYSESDLQEKQGVVEKYYVELFKEKLDIDEDLASVLVEEGFDDFETIAYLPMEEYLEIEGFDKDLVFALKERAENVLKIDEKAKKLVDFKTLHPTLVQELNDKGVKTIEDLAYLSIDDLKEIVKLRTKEAHSIIVEAKGSFFD